MEERNTLPAAAPPFWVFLIGMNEEWAEDRRTVGDYALWSAFTSVVPESQVVFVADEHATQENVLRQLESLLQRMKGGAQEPCQVVFYYGGHGEKGHFCLENNLCPHRAVVDVIEAHVRSCDTVWMLIDCCFSGSFYQALQERKSDSAAALCGSYCVLMSTTASAEAGPEWTLTESWIRAMEGRLVPSLENHGSLRGANHSGDAKERLVTSAEVIHRISQKVARVEKDTMTTFTCGDNISLESPFPFNIGRVLVPEHGVGSDIHPPDLIDRNLTGRVDGHCVMAQSFKYFTFAIPVDTYVWAIWGDDDCLYNGMVVSDSILPWFKMSASKFPTGIGPFVVVKWAVDKKWSIIPLGRCVVREHPYDVAPTVSWIRETARVAAENERAQQSTPMNALLKSFASAGKTLRNAEEVVGSTTLLCFWQDTSEWLSATAGYLEDDALDSLATHLDYDDAGDYCIVTWEVDGKQSCLPIKFVRKQSLCCSLAFRCGCRNPD